MSSFFSNSSQSKNANSAILPAVLGLAAWQLRRTWFLLCMTMLGIIAAVLITCAVPLFSAITTTAGLRSILREQPTSSEINVRIAPIKFSSRILYDIQRQVDSPFQHNLKPYLRGTTQFTAQASNISVISPKEVPEDLFSAYAAPMQQIAPHIRLLSGHLPLATYTTDKELNLLITPNTAFGLGVHVGSSLTLNMSYYVHMPNPNDDSSVNRIVEHIKVRVAGLFTVDQTDIPYWHGTNFEPFGFPPLVHYSALFSLDGFLSLFNHLATQMKTDAPFTNSAITISWYYQLDALRISVSQLDTLIRQLSSLQSTLNVQYADVEDNSPSFSNPPDYPYISGVQIVSPLFDEGGIPSNLEQYRNRMTIISIPIFIVSSQILVLVLFFVSIMTSMLVEHATASIALLKSRGASNTQIFGAFLTQFVGLTGIGTLVGVPLTILIVPFVAKSLLPSTTQDALTVVTDHPFQAFLTTILYAGIVMFIVLVTISFSLMYATRMDILSLRRNIARTTRRPFWQRLGFDIFAGILALAGYFLSLYLASISSILGESAKTFIVIPLSLLAPFSLVLGCLLFFLRGFPLLLRFAEQLAIRGRSATPMLALAQMSRSPYHALRMTMLLALVIAFALFSMSFTASQEHIISDLATYQAGADFSGSMLNRTRQTTLREQTQAYKALPEVLSASVGYAGSGTVGGGEGNKLTIEVRAIDTSTFSQTAMWPSGASSWSLNSLLSLLNTKRQYGIQHHIIPVIIDTTTATKLSLHSGSTFFVSMNDNTNGDQVQVRDLPCIVIGIVQYIPTTSSGPDSVFTVSNSNTPSNYGGVLLDYQTYNTFYLSLQKARGFRGPGIALPINYAWLHTRADATSLARIRSALNTSNLYLGNLNDRYAIIARLHADPLVAMLSGILNIGTLATIILAVLGTLLASWSSVLTRLNNFAVLRALGSSLAQISSVLTWEQGLVYTVGLLLGVVCGLVLANTIVLPIISNIINVQSGLSTRLVLPLSLLGGLVAVVAIFTVTLRLMVHTVVLPSLSQTLRSNED